MELSNMQRLLNGVRRFQRDIFPKERPLFRRLASGQNPEALFLTCADSRVVPDLITQTRPGDLFICRNAGNIAPPYGEAAGGVSATSFARSKILSSDMTFVTGILHREGLRE